MAAELVILSAEIDILRLDLLPWLRGRPTPLALMVAASTSVLAQTRSVLTTQWDDWGVTKYLPRHDNQNSVLHNVATLLEL